MRSKTMLLKQGRCIFIHSPSKMDILGLRLEVFFRPAELAKEARDEVLTH